MAKIHDVFFGDVTVRGKLRSDDFAAEDFSPSQVTAGSVDADAGEFGTLSARSLAATSAEVGSLSCAEFVGHDFAERAFAAGDVKFFFGQDVGSRAAGSGREIYLCCRGAVTAGEGEIAVWASPDLAIDGVTDDNWTRVFRDGAAERQIGALRIRLTADGAMTVVGRDGMISADETYTQSIALPVPFADETFSVVASPCVPISPSDAKYFVTAVAAAPDRIDVTVNALENTRVGFFEFLAVGRRK